VFIYSVQHLLILRLFMCYKFQDEAVLHHLLFLVSAAKSEEQALGFYDFKRLGKGAYSCNIQRLLADLKAEKLIEEGDGCLQITDQGRHVYISLGSSLRAFTDFWDLCFTIMERYQGDSRKLKRRVFSDITFRRTRIGERIFDYCLY
jgi:hypothetical protein